MRHRLPASGGSQPATTGCSAVRWACGASSVGWPRGARPTLGGDRRADDSTLAAAVDRLAHRRPRWFAASTGMGMRLLVESAERTGRRDTLVGVLQAATVVARGLKATGALRRLGIEPMWTSPGERDEQVAAWLAARVQPGDAAVVQVHGAGTHPYGRLADAGADLEVVAAYVSTPPEDPAPGTRLARAVAAARLDVVTFTAPGAVDGLAHLADAAGIADQVRAALCGPVAVAAVGPVTGAAVGRAGYVLTIRPDDPRSGALVRAVMTWWNART
jgi:uroporphyrinogen-III synthase